MPELRFIASVGHSSWRWGSARCCWQIARTVPSSIEDDVPKVCVDRAGLLTGRQIAASNLAFAIIAADRQRAALSRIEPCEAVEKCLYLRSMIPGFERLGSWCNPR